MHLSSFSPRTARQKRGNQQLAGSGGNGYSNARDRDLFLSFPRQAPPTTIYQQTTLEW
jgi:hypothetical protein